MSLDSSANPNMFGQPVTIKAKLTDFTATGAIAFYNWTDGFRLLGKAPVSSGEASITVLMPFGPQSIWAAYSGDATFASAIGGPLNIQVSTAPISYVDFANAPAEDGAQALAAADLNNDGKADLVLGYTGTANGGPGNGGVSIRLGKGDGTFQDAVDYVVGGQVIDLAVGDFNGDGLPDIAVAVRSNSNGDSGTGWVAILLQNPDHTFAAPVTLTTGGSPRTIAAVDLNLDFRTDLVLGNNNGNVQVFMGNGDGSFNDVVNYNVGGAPRAVKTGDFDGDGKPDVVFADFMNNTVGVLLGVGDGTLQVPAIVTPLNDGSGPVTAAGPIAIVVGFLNGSDGNQDVATANYNTGNISVLFGNGDGTFQAPTNFQAGMGPRSIALFDTRAADNQPHGLFVTNFGSNNVTVLSTRDNGGFDNPQNLDLPAGAVAPAAVVVTELNGDSREDIVTANAGTAGTPGSSTLTLMKGVVLPNLSISVDSSGAFYRGMTGTYQLNVANRGEAATSGLVTVTDTLPAGLTVASLSGTGWACDAATVTCTRSDVLAANSNYPPIDLVVNVGVSAVSQSVDTATVSGGNDSDSGDNTAMISTFVANTSDVAVGVSHKMDFAPGQNNGLLSITISNLSETPGSNTADPITLTVTLPSSMTPVQMGAPYWQCVLATLTCTNNMSSLPPGGSVSIGLGVSVSSNAAPGTAQVTASVSYPGDSNSQNNFSADNVTIRKAVTTVMLYGSPSPAPVNSPVNFMVQVNADLPNIGAPAGTVTLFDGTTQIGSASLDQFGKATVTVNGLTAGQHQITASYPGDSSRNAAASDVFYLMVSSMKMSTTALHFGNTGVNVASAPMQVILSNAAGGPMNIPQLSSPSPDFSVTNGTCSQVLPAGSNCYFVVTFRPQSTGFKSGTLNINIPGAPLNLQMDGTGVNSSVTLDTTAMHFGRNGVLVPSNLLTATLVNYTGSAVALSGISAPSGEFQVTNNCPATLPGGKACFFRVAFVAQSAGYKSATMTITAGDSQLLLPLDGTGVSSSVTIDTTTMHFGHTGVQVPSNLLTATLVNYTGSAVTLSGISAPSGDFQVTNNCPATLGNGKACIFRVAFVPQSVGYKSATMTITGGGAPISLPLDGTGVNSSVTLDKTAMHFGHSLVQVSSNLLTAMLVNYTGSPVTLNGIVAPSGDFQVTNNCPATLGVGKACIFRVAFVPQSAGYKSATMTINAGAQQLSLPLDGTGVQP